MAIRFLVESHIVVDNFSCSLHVCKNLTFYNFMRNLRFEFFPVCCVLLVSKSSNWLYIVIKIIFPSTSERPYFNQVCVYIIFFHKATNYCAWFEYHRLWYNRLYTNIELTIKFNIDTDNRWMWRNKIHSILKISGPFTFKKQFR